MSIIYNLLLVILTLIALPLGIYRFIVKKKYRSSLWYRLGIGFPQVEKGDRPLIWIHAVSVGETKAVALLAKQIKKNWGNPLLIISSVTETGHAEAKKTLPFADYHVYLPLDFSWIAGPILRRVRPDLLLLTESDFWFNFLSLAKKNGTKIALVNGKISERSLSRFQRNKWFSKKLFSFIDLYLVQSELYADRFLKLWIPNEKIIVTGNLKYDTADDHLSKEELERWKNGLGVHKEDIVLVLGSTHEREEKLIFSVLKEVWKKIPKLKVIVAPRHPERFLEVANILSQMEIPFTRYSKLENSENVLLMDAMGLLRKCYQIADIALVGGSFIPKVGGHSIIEPSQYAVPVIFGPYMHAQQDMVALVGKYRSALQVNPEELLKALLNLLEDPIERRKIGDAGALMIKDLHGITKKTEKALCKITEIGYSNAII